MAKPAENQRRQQAARRARDEQSEARGNGRLDERVKIPLPFEDALRGLLATDPDKNGEPEKQQEPPKPRRR